MTFLFPLLALFQSVPYEESFRPIACEPSEAGRTFASLYKAYRNEGSISEEYLIPKLIHFIWLGSPLPASCRKMISTWKKMHPSWTILVWNDESVARFGLANKDAFDKAVNFGEKSDIARYEILYRYGGVYADTDFECLKPFDELHRSCGLYAGVNGDNQCLLNGLIGASPRHPVMRACIEHLKAGPGDHDENRIMQSTGPYLFTRMFLDYAAKAEGERIVPFPPSFFYSYPGSMRDFSKDPEEIKRNFVKPESFAIHYWASAWMRNKP